MTVHELLNLLADRGIHLYVDAGQLRYRAPAGEFTAALQALTKAHRAELVEILSHRASCPTCQLPGHRLGTYHDEDGRGRWECRSCRVVWWAPIENAGDALDVRPWYEDFTAELTEEAYQAVIAHDLIAYGRYVSSRRYSVPAEDPRAIWERLGLRAG